MFPSAPSSAASPTGYNQEGDEVYNPPVSSPSFLPFSSSDAASSAVTVTDHTTITQARLASLGLTAFGVLFVVASLSIAGAANWDTHAAFLGGLGNLPLSGTHAEPANALSIPTWAIHFSSVLEYLVAMQLVWQFSEATGNEKYKGLVWGMLPLHASGICACTYHFFYNAPSLQFLVTAQAGLTLLGNLTCMLAAFRIAQSNGWSWSDLFKWFPASPTSPQGLVVDSLAAKPLEPVAGGLGHLSNTQLTGLLVGATLAMSYGIKYGSLQLDLPFEPNPLAATGLIVLIPGLTAFQYYTSSKASENGEQPSSGGLFSMFSSNNDSADDGKPRLSMATVKEFGVAGTLAYVLTELAFWAVAFPVAAAALYQSTGHWPNVIEDTGDRAAVAALVFAGANVARVLVPLRLGAAIALAPWVQENIIKGGSSDKVNGDDAGVVNTSEGVSNTRVTVEAGMKESEKVR
jgi:Protein of unknown function (DUF2499)